MWYDELFAKIESMRDTEQGQKMSDYMKNMFPFLGIKKPLLLKTIRPFFKNCKTLDWNFVRACWDKDYREAQYAAIVHMEKYKKLIGSKDIENLEYLITHKSWWETVDSLDAFVGQAVLEDSSLSKKMLNWSQSDNLWLRRVSIDFQQRFKEQTNTELLAECIKNNFGSKEFFINKAIGWSLREYSKVNPQWVKDFVNKNENNLNSLSFREALKITDSSRKNQ